MLAEEAAEAGDLLACEATAAAHPALPEQERPSLTNHLM